MRRKKANVGPGFAVPARVERCDDILVPLENPRRLKGIFKELRFVQKQIAAHPDVNLKVQTLNKLLEGRYGDGSGTPRLTPERSVAVRRWPEIWAEALSEQLAGRDWAALWWETKGNANEIGKMIGVPGMYLHSILDGQLYGVDPEIRAEIIGGKEQARRRLNEGAVGIHMEKVLDPESRDGSRERMQFLRHGGLDEDWMPRDRRLLEARPAPMQITVVVPTEEAVRAVLEAKRGVGALGESGRGGIRVLDVPANTDGDRELGVHDRAANGGVVEVEAQPAAVGVPPQPENASVGSTIAEAGCELPSFLR